VSFRKKKRVVQNSFVDFNGIGKIIKKQSYKKRRKLQAFFISFIELFYQCGSTCILEGATIKKLSSQFIGIYSEV
jgi:hypothetical protein